MAGKNADFINGSAPQCDDTWLDIHSQELKNAIETSGQTINDGDNFQLSKAMANYAAVSSFYIDSGAANAYVLTPIGALKSPNAYYNGMEIKFRAVNAGTGIAATVNVDGLGPKSLKRADGSTNPIIGDIPTTEDSVFRYDGSVFRKKNAIDIGFVNSKLQSGYTYLPNGLIFQWGINAITSGAVVNFPIAFPTSVFVSVSSNYGPGLLDTAEAVTNTQITLYHSNGVIASLIKWVAIGY
jgi:hypothetical protein